MTTIEQCIEDAQSFVVYTTSIEEVQELSTILEQHIAGYLDGWVSRNFLEHGNPFEDLPTICLYIQYNIGRASWGIDIMTPENLSDNLVPRFHLTVKEVSFNI